MDDIREQLLVSFYYVFNFLLKEFEKARNMNATI